MYVQQAYFAKCQTTAKPQTTLKFNDQGYKTEFQVSLPSILGPLMEPNSLCFLTLITKLHRHLALSGPSLFCKIPLWSIYTVHVQYRSKVDTRSSKLETLSLRLKAWTLRVSRCKDRVSRREYRVSSFDDRGFVYAKVNESHPMHRAVIFRMKGKCTLLERALSRLEIWNSILNPQSSKLETRSFRCETRSSKVSRIESCISRIKMRVTVNLLLSGTIYTLKVPISKRMANIFLSISSQITCKTNL